MICCNFPKILANLFHDPARSPKGADGMAKGSSLIWVCIVCLDLSVPILEIITVSNAYKELFINITFQIFSPSVKITLNIILL